MDNLETDLNYPPNTAGPFLIHPDLFALGFIFSTFRKLNSVLEKFCIVSRCQRLLTGHEFRQEFGDNAKNIHLSGKGIGLF